jgi:hypothetical protein
VADAEGAFEGMFAEDLFEVSEFAGSATYFEKSGVGAADGDSS